MIDSSASAIRRVLLQTPRRRMVFEGIEARPGTHVRQISRHHGLALGVVEHHVRVLERYELVFAIDGTRRRSLYSADHISPEDARHIHMLGRDHWPAILTQLMQGEPMGVQEFADQLAISPSTASYHLRRMKQDGIVTCHRVGRQSIYLLDDPGPWRRVLHQPAPLDALVRRASQHSRRELLPTQY